MDNRIKETEIIILVMKCNDYQELLLQIEFINLILNMYYQE